MYCRYIPFYFVVFLLFAFQSASGQAFSTAVKVNSSSGKQSAPRITFAPDGRIYIGWIDFSANSGGDLVICFSTDAGSSFSTPVTVRSGGTINTDFQRGLRIAASAGGILHVIWMENRINNQPDIWYSRSTDAGYTFSTPQSLSGDSSKWAQDFPSLAVDGKGGVYVCYLDSRETQQQLSTNVQLYFTHSTDNGETWFQPRRITYFPDGIGGTCECCATDMAVSSEGHVYCAFRSNRENIRDIYIIRSLDGGETFEAPVKAASEDWYIDSCPVTGPSISLDATETLHIAWRDSRPSSAGKNFVFYTSLPYMANACGLDKRISATVNRSDYPSVCAVPGGAVLCAFEDARNDNGDIFWTYSLDGGATFGSPVPVTGGSIDRKQQFAVCSIHPQTGTRYILWQDGRNDQGDIYLATDATNLFPATSVDCVLNPLQYKLGACYPNPVHAGNDAYIPVSGNHASLTVAVYDVYGRKLLSVRNSTASTIRIPTSAFKPGVYFFNTPGTVMQRFAILQ